MQGFMNSAEHSLPVLHKTRTHPPGAAATEATAAGDEAFPGNRLPVPGPAGKPARDCKGKGSGIHAAKVSPRGQPYGQRPAVL
ncbi:hypothetical protein ACH41H_47795 [Streptomyces sp. NPDC020800]|uniref:hypothetical protein n=1 Tax=Streptomyces sp. NPDC020800 TaxID=3365092 RepID=UPI00379EC28A